MRKNAFDAKKHIGQFNVERNKLIARGSFTKEELLKAFKNSGIPSSPLFWDAFRKFGHIQQISKGKYMFTYADKPMYYSALDQVYKEYNKRVKQHRDKYRTKKVEEPVTVEIVQPQVQFSIEDAISLLKENGYKILKPVGIIYSAI